MKITDVEAIVLRQPVLGVDLDPEVLERYAVGGKPLRVPV